VFRILLKRSGDKWVNSLQLREAAGGYGDCAALNVGWEDTGDMHQGVMGRIREFVWKASTHRERFIIHAFGKKTTVPTQQEDPYMTGITYFFTSNSPKMKPFSIENVMLVNMLSMATETRVACDFVILTRKDLSQAIHFLRSLGHSVTTAMASCFDQSLHLMRDASNNTIIWPN
ncbi:hypothetical protein Tco_1106185, partial [Tanacetum coccineum]